MPRRRGTLTEYAIELHDERLAPLGFTLGSPRDPIGVGRTSPSAAPTRAALLALAEAGVITDFRMPDTIRLGCSPLTTSFAEVWDGVDRLCEILSAG